jgi:curli biogenesis system outer membrane secretion channel CsgG
MKTLLLDAAAAMGPIMLSGCATHEATTTTTTTANPANQTYSRSELNQTGQPDTAGAISGVDPGAQIR